MPTCQKRSNDKQLSCKFYLIHICILVLALLFLALPMGITKVIAETVNVKKDDNALVVQSVIDVEQNAAIPKSKTDSEPDNYKEVEKKASPSGQEPESQETLLSRTLYLLQSSPLSIYFLITSVLVTMLTAYFLIRRKRNREFKRFSKTSKSAIDIKGVRFGLIDRVFRSLKRLIRIDIWKEKKTEDGVADIIVSDLSIERIDQDLLGTSKLARGISLFLQNRNTKPPITISITGEWGSGKSSLMGMLQDDLNRARFATVWFNAWHHHQEKQLFGSLIDSIHKEAIPFFLSISGMLFRIRLLLGRIKRHPLILLLAFFLIIFLLAMWPSTGEWEQWFNNINSFSLLDILSKSKETGIFGFFVTLIATIITIIAFISKGLSAFGFNPSKLFQSAGRALKLITFTSDPGLRYRIGQSLGDITKALGKKTLVIFIDDLDRCPSDQILNILETVNFLSSTPCRCHIIMGMALDKVLNSISGEFRAVVEEAAFEKSHEDDEARRIRLKIARYEYAKNYLEKLINIEINVPKASSEQIQQLAEISVDTGKSGERGKFNLRKFSRILDRKVFPIILILFISLMLFVAGRQVSILQHNGPSVSISEKDKNNNEGDSNSTMEKVQRIADSDRIIYIYMANLALLIIALVLSAFSSKRIEIKDTNYFIQALKIWTDAITINNPTPRHYKRSINQLRFLAMKKRNETDHIQEAIRKSVVFVVLKAFREFGVVSKEALLKVSKIKNQTESEATDNNMQLDKTLKSLMLSLKIPEKNIGKLTTAIKEHFIQLKTYWPNEYDIDDYDEMMKGVTLR